MEHFIVAVFAVLTINAVLCHGLPHGFLQTNNVNNVKHSNSKYLLDRSDTIPTSRYPKPARLDQGPEIVQLAPFFEPFGPLPFGFQVPCIYGSSLNRVSRDEKSGSIQQGKAQNLNANPLPADTVRPQPQGSQSFAQKTEGDETGTNSSVNLDEAGQQTLETIDPLTLKLVRALDREFEEAAKQMLAFSKQQKKQGNSQEPRSQGDEALENYRPLQAYPILFPQSRGLIYEPALR